MLRSIFKWRVILIGCLLLLVPAALAQETDLCEDVDLIEYGDAGDGQIDDGEFCDGQESCGPEMACEKDCSACTPLE